MSRTLNYLVYFVLYSLAILIIGRSSFRESDSVSKFFVGERRTGLGRLFFTFVGTWISAATILGYTGNVYQNGTGVITMSVIPWFIGAVMLYAISDRLYDNDILTIPQMLRQKYQSRGLQIASALLMSGGYVLYLVMQIKGFGLAASSLLNIDYKVAIFLVYLFILYSTFGGFNSVTKTDACNLIMLAISIGIIYFVVIGNVDHSSGLRLLNDNAVAEQINGAAAAGDGAGLYKGGSALIYISMFFGWGMGLAANPQYMIRIVAAKDKKTAKRMLLCAIAFLAVFYFLLTQIGLGLKILFPALGPGLNTDDIFVFAINSLIHSRFSGFFLISVIGACISTANSQLLLIGSMLSYDVAGQLGKTGMKDEKVLFYARWFIFIGGTAALALSVNPPANILLFGADIWGLFSAVFAPIIYGALLCSGYTKKGAYGAFITGLVSTLIFRQMDMAVYWAFPATACSTAVYLLIPFLEKRKREHR